MIELELPFPPSVNHYYRRVGPRTLISRQGRAYRNHVCSALVGLGVRTMTGPLRVDVEAYPPDRRQRDSDNLLKALLDALEHGGAYVNDSQVQDLHIRMLSPVKGGMVLVRLEKINAT